MLELKQVQGELQCIAFARATDFVDSSTLRVSTPFKYPDGSFIDVFVEIENALPSQAKVSDFSQTFTWLLDLAISVPRTGRRKNFLTSILNTYGVTENEGELQLYINKANDLPNAVLSIAQASLRVSDLMFTQRLARATDFNDNFEDFLEALELTFNARRFEVRDKTVVIPYYTKSERVSSLVQTLSTKSLSSAPQISRDAFVRWYDIRDELPEALRITVFDDQNDIIRSSDLDRLNDWSKIIPWSDQSTLAETLLG